MSGVARVGAIALQGIDGSRVTVEAGVTRQLPGIAIVGLPDAALTEAKQRVRHAAAAMGLALTDRFVLVNLRPADLPKHGSSFDLAIALAVLCVSGGLANHPHMAETAHVAELGLDGTLRRPRGLLSAVIAAKAQGYSRTMVPLEALAEAQLVPGIEVIGAEDLQGAVNWYRKVQSGWSMTRSGASRDVPSGTVRDSSRPSEPASDIADVIGQELAVEALTIAAAGRHHLQMVGPPGAGKTMLASRLPTILPELSDEEALSVSSIQSLVTHSSLTQLERFPPFQQPHHTASAASIIGSGRGGMLIPGTVSLASFGVLFLDEAAEFGRNVLDALRQPLERGEIDIHRVGVRATLPAKVQLVLAQNPCPCGKAGLTIDDLSCICTPLQRRRYASRLSGPLRDRLDVRIKLQRVSRVGQDVPAAPSVTSSDIRAKVIEARAAAEERLRGTTWKVNADVPGSWLRSGRMRLPARTTAVIDRALSLGNLTLRGYDRSLRVAWSIADLEGTTSPGREEITRALMLREDS